jgi:hypothetical protein
MQKISLQHNRIKLQARLHLQAHCHLAHCISPPPQKLYVTTTSHAARQTAALTNTFDKQRKSTTAHKNNAPYAAYLIVVLARLLAVQALPLGWLRIALV